MLFDDVEDWKKWKSDPFNVLEKKYGKEFADWARENNGKIPKYWIEAGCKTLKEYKDKLAQYAGFKDYAERMKDWLHWTGRNLPKELNTECSSWFGEFTENLMIQTFEDPVKMHYGNPGFDWLCKNGEKIDNKGRCLQHAENQSERWIFHINHNNIADWFILSAWDNRDSLTPLHVWAFHKNDIVRGKKFWRRETFSISNTLEGLKEFEKYEITDRLDRLKKLYNKKLKTVILF